MKKKYVVYYRFVGYDEGYWSTYTLLIDKSTLDKELYNWKRSYVDLSVRVEVVKK